MLTRDYLMLKVWDMNMESRPVESYPVHEYLKGKLCTLYENDSIFDKFECAWSGNDRLVLYLFSGNTILSLKPGVPNQKWPTKPQKVALDLKKN